MEKRKRNDLPTSTTDLNFKSHAEPIPCTRNNKWSTVSDSPLSMSNSSTPRLTTLGLC